MKFILTLATLVLAPSSALLAQASGPNTPPVGSIVPDGLTFSLANSTAAELAGGNSLGASALVSYNDFSGQILAVVYHASW